MKRSAFTMIELVFVIVIIGILTAIAIPKFLGVRDSANATKEVGNLRTATNDIQAQFMLSNSTLNLPTFASYNIKCFDYNLTNDGNLTVEANVTSVDAYCPLAVVDANKSGLMGSRKF